MDVFDRKLVWVVQGASALSLGTLAALIYSIKSLTPRIEFEVTAATLIAFTLAALASVVFWHLAFRLSSAADDPAAADGDSGKRRRRALAVLSAVFLVALVAAFAYPLKDFSSEKISEIGKGSFLALCFLTVLGILFWRIVRYLERA